MACGKCSRAVGEPHQSWCAYDSWLGNHAVDSKRAVTMGAEIEAAEAKRYAAMNHYTEDGGAVVWFFCSPWSWDLADADERKYLDDEDADPDGYADTREEAMALALGWEKATPYQWINRSRGLSIAMRSDGVWLANSPLDKDPFAVRVCKSIPHAIAAAQGDV